MIYWDAEWDMSLDETNQQSITNNSCALFLITLSKNICFRHNF